MKQRELEPMGQWSRGGSSCEQTMLISASRLRCRVDDTVATRAALP